MGNNRDYDFTNFSSLRELFRAIYYGEILIPAAETEQDDFDNSFEKLLINAENFYDEKKTIIEAFKNKIFPLSNPDYYPEYT